MKFIVDAQLPPALVRSLRDAGHEAFHVADLGLHTAPDAVIWQEARRLGAVILTKDEDFVVGDPTRLRAPAPPIVWLRFGNVSSKVMLSVFVPMLEDVVTLIESGEKVIEIR